jgi:hypothetical protein
LNPSTKRSAAEDAASAPVGKKRRTEVEDTIGADPRGSRKEPTIKETEKDEGRMWMIVDGYFNHLAY